MTRTAISGEGHTPGPWETRRARTPDNTGGYDWAIAKDGKVIAEAFEHVGFADGGAGFDKRPASANARLISASPDLLEALEGLLPTAGSPVVLPDTAERVRKAVAAIAKARGEAL